MCPQLAVYDGLAPTLSPYLTFTSPRNHRSAVVNTDAAGFRLSSSGAACLDTTTWPGGRPAGLVLGNSFVFGVGASSDGETLVSHLNALLPQAFLNLGVRAGNSTQELIAAIPFLERADCIVMCSGVNNLVVNLQSLGMNELFGPFFGEGTYDPLRDRPLSEVADEVAGTSTLLRWKRRAHRVVARVRVRPPAPRFEGRTRGPGADAGGWDERCVRAIELQRRDLRILARARRPGSTLVFAVQPFAPCCGKAPSPEERRLTELSDRCQGQEWEGLKHALTTLWPRYVSALRQMCAEEAVRCVDLNACPLTGWSFVDRVHMTDAGYRQVAGFLTAQIAGSQCAS